MAKGNRTIYVIDDDEAARASVAALVKSRNLKVIGYASAEEFLAAYDPAQRGCAVVDIRLPGMSGLELQRRLTSMRSPLQVIIITGHGDVPTAVQAMQAGAVHFLEKPCFNEGLWTHIERALDAEALSQEQETLQAELQRRFNSLNAAERRVLDSILAGKGNKAIAMELDIGLRTVELRRSNIMKKMQAESLAELVRFVFIAQGREPA